MNFQKAALMVLEQAEHLTPEQVDDLAQAQGCVRGRTTSDRHNARFLLARLAEAIPQDRQDEYWTLIGGKRNGP